jgi:hypothetical protein
MPSPSQLAPADRQAAAVLLVCCLSLTLLYYPANSHWLLDCLRNTLPTWATVFQHLVVHNPDTQLYRALFWSLASVASYCLLPLLHIKLVLRRPLSDFGLALPSWRLLCTDGKLFLLFYAIMLPLVWWASAQPVSCTTSSSALAHKKACGRTGPGGSCYTSPNSPRWSSSFAATWCTASSRALAYSPSS